MLFGASLAALSAMSPRVADAAGLDRADAPDGAPPGQADRPAVRQFPPIAPVDFALYLPGRARMVRVANSSRFSVPEATPAPGVTKASAETVPRTVVGPVTDAVTRRT